MTRPLNNDTLTGNRLMKKKDVEQEPKQDTFRKLGIPSARHAWGIVLALVCVMSFLVYNGSYSLRALNCGLYTGSVWGGFLFAFYWSGKRVFHSLSWWIGLPQFCFFQNSQQPEYQLFFLCSFLLPLFIAVSIMYKKIVGRIARNH